MGNFIRRVRHLRFSMSLTEAVRMAWNERRDGSFETCPSAAAFPVVLRGGTSDIRCFEKIFVQHGYSPPRELGPFEPRVIIDAGANVGLATVYFASIWPYAKILAIEPEDSNFRLLERNCANFPNVIAVKGALWASSGDLSLTQRGDQPWGYAVTDRLPPQAATRVRAFTVPDLMAMAGTDHVDFLQLDIEGAEKELFSKQADGWLDRVSVLAIELHDRFVAGCSQALYSRLIGRNFQQEISGENVFIRLLGSADGFKESRK